MATQYKKKTLDKPVALRKVHVSIPTGREEDKELEANLRRIRCLELLGKSWRVRSEEMVRELVTREVNHIYSSTIRGRLRVQAKRRRHDYKEGGLHPRQVLQEVGSQV
jgi:hypothetical protein